MRTYKSAVFKHLHEEMKYLHSVGDITTEKLREFEQDCFKPAADTPQGRAARTPAMTATSPGPRDRSIK
jgi:putative transcriptional regulator